jgi:adenine deaminase
VPAKDGRWCFAPDRDLALAACIERHRASGKIGLGLVRGFAFQRHGALGSSVAHDSHNLIIAGTNPSDMLVCVRALARSGGGFVAAADGQVLAELALSIAGLMSTANVRTVRHQLQQLHAAAQTLGCPLPSPFAVLSFLPLPVIPELRVTPRGLFDAGKQQFVSIQ